MTSTSTNNNSSASTSNPTSGNSANNNNSLAGGDSRWYFTAEQLGNSPSRRQGIDADEELSYRQMTAYLIQEMGQRLQVSQLCINTAIVYMHRFYAFHSFTHFHRNGIAAASLFLAAKVEEQPRKLEHVIKAAHLCLNQEPPASNSDVYAEQAQDLVFNENVLLQTLGFDVAIDHPHTHVVKTCHLVKACKDLAQTSYFLASNSLHLTSMCLQYRPTVVACFCIYLACKWSRWEIPQSTEGKHWFHYVDKSVTMELLQQLTNEFIAIYEKSPARLKSKLNSVKAIAQGARIPEPPRNASDSSNGSSSSQQLGQVPSTVIQQQSQPSSSSSSSSSSVSSRRPETTSASHSSHHRSHHAGVQHPHHHHHHHHHSKHTNATDVIDHKQPNKTYSNNTSHSNRPRAERAHQQPHIGQSAVNNEPSSQYQTNKQMSQSKSGSGNSNSSRSGMSQITNIPPILQPQQSISLGSSGRQNLPSQMHDMSYHKNRVNPNSGSLPNQINSQIANHKIVSSKNQIDANRNMLKDPNNVRDAKIPVKHNSLNSNSGNVYSQQQPSVGLDMTRNVLQQQQQQNQPKGYVQNQMPSGLQPPTNYQQQPNCRGNSSSGNNNSNVSNNLNSGSKFEQSVQQQSLLSQHQPKQSIEASSFSHSSTTGSSSTTFNPNNSQITNDHMDICSPPRYSTSQNQVQQPPISTQSHKPFLSIFSPDYNEKQQQLSQQISQQVGNNISSSNSKQIFSNKISRDSPKKEKRSSTPKKEKRSEALNLPSEQKIIDKRLVKNDVLSSNSASMAPINLNYVSSNSQSQSSQLTDFNYNAPKRPNSVKVEEDAGRETKIRKIDHPTVEVRPASFLFDQPSNQAGNSLLPNSSNNVNIQETTKTKIYPSTINGIETNPDLVSSLLKESLCNENKYASQPSLIKTERPESPISTTSSVITANTFIKTEPALSPIQSGYNINPMESLPQELLQNTSTFTTPFVNIKQEPNQFPVSTPVINNVAIANQPFTTISQPPLSHQQQITSQPQVQQQQLPPQQQQLQLQSQSQQQTQPQLQSQQPQSSDEYSKSKSEKKKKKDKHKHKEKDKSKDKEERKKHKKDKDKHKDKDKDREKSLNINEQSEPVKLKIPKEKLNLPPIEAINVSPGQLKIKIPKDRIKTEINTNNDLDGQIGATNQTMPQMPLKIKISKDKIGSFGHDSISVTTSQHSSSIGHNSSSGNLSSNNLSISGNITGSSSNSKKKDRDKDKDKERKRNNEVNKHNSNGGSGNNSSGISGSTAPSKSTSSKIQQYMQLFGDSNDEDSDDNSSDTDSISQQQNQQRYQQQQHQQIQNKANYSHNNLYTGINNNNNNNNNNSISNNSNSIGYQYNENKKYNSNNYNNTNNNQQHQYQQNFK